MKIGAAVLAVLTWIPAFAGTTALPAQQHDAKAGQHAGAPDTGAGTTTTVEAQGKQPPATPPGAHDAGHAPPQGGGDHPPGAEEHAESNDIIMPHILNSDYLEFPWPNGDWAIKLHLPHWAPIKIGGMEIDISPTKHSVMLAFAALLAAVILIYSARSQAKRAREGKPPRGLANAMEAMVLYMRSEIVLPNVGPHGEKYVPYLLTVFFLVLFANLLGLIPFAATATSNIGVTATLAVMAFLVVEISGMAALGPGGYMKTIIFWPHEGNIFMKVMLSLIISPIELMGKFTKPFALAIRLFANMTAGHIIVLSMIGLVFTFGNWLIAPAPIGMAVGVMLLEVLVAFLQAFIFTLLVSVFIGQVRTAAH